MRVLVRVQMRDPDACCLQCTDLCDRLNFNLCLRDAATQQSAAAGLKRCPVAISVADVSAPALCNSMTD
jgi:hypothetical protein